jgi:hypothetical protein
VRRRSSDLKLGHWLVRWRERERESTYELLGNIDKVKQVQRKLQVSKPKQNKGRDVRVICLPKPIPANSAVSSQSRAQKLGPGLTGMWRPAVRGGRQLLASSSSLLSYSVAPPYSVHHSSAASSTSSTWRLPNEPTNLQLNPSCPPTSYHNPPSPPTLHLFEPSPSNSTPSRHWSTVSN